MFRRRRKKVTPGPKLLASAQAFPFRLFADLKNALVGAAPAFDAHLEHAKKIQAALASGGSAAHDHGK